MTSIEERVGILEVRMIAVVADMREAKDELKGTNKRLTWLIVVLAFNVGIGVVKIWGHIPL